MEKLDISLIFIIICSFFMGIILLSKPLKFIFNFCFKSVLGLSFIFVLNLLFKSFDVYVGINYLNAIIVGLLGIPGIITLYITQLIL